MSTENPSTRHILTAIAKVMFEYKKGDKDSKATAGLSMLYAEGEIDENIFLEVSDGQKQLSKRGMQALQRVLSYAIAQNIKHLENSGHQKAEDRDEHLTKMVAYIKKELVRMDEINFQCTPIAEPIQNK